MDKEGTQGAPATLPLDANEGNPRFFRGISPRGSMRCFPAGGRAICGSFGPIGPMRNTYSSGASAENPRFSRGNLSQGPVRFFHASRTIGGPAGHSGLFRHPYMGQPTHCGCGGVYEDTEFSDDAMQVSGKRQHEADNNDDRADYKKIRLEGMVPEMETDYQNDEETVTMDTAPVEAQVPPPVEPPIPMQPHPGSGQRAPRPCSGWML